MQNTTSYSWVLSCDSQDPNVQSDWSRDPSLSLSCYHGAEDQTHTALHMTVYCSAAEHHLPIEFYLTSLFLSQYDTGQISSYRNYSLPGLELDHDRAAFLDTTRTERTYIVDTFKYLKAFKKKLRCKLTANFKRNQFVFDLIVNPGKTQKYILCVTLRFYENSNQKSKEKSGLQDIGTLKKNPTRLSGNP